MLVKRGSVHINRVFITFFNVNFYSFYVNRDLFSGVDKTIFLCKYVSFVYSVIFSISSYNLYDILEVQVLAPSPLHYISRFH